MLEMHEDQSIDSVTTEEQRLDISDKALFDSEFFQTAKNKNKLLRVALLNSYLKGQSHLIEVDSNTILTGRNSAGKTTLMGAIVPFLVPSLAVSLKSQRCIKALWNSICLMPTAILFTNT